MKIEVDPKPEKKYKDFDETFPLCAFSLAFAFLYPNRIHVWIRAFLITAIIAVNGGQLFWFLCYTYKCLYSVDVYNFARQMTLTILLSLFFIKTYYIISATPNFALLLRWQSRDLLRANNLTEDYQNIYNKYIKMSKTAEWFWLLIPVVLSSSLPIYSGICMSIESVSRDDYKRMMVHDMEMLYVEHIQYEWPFFHMYFAYNCCQCIVLVPNYCGFDGSFCIVTTHLRMKLKLLVHRLQEAFSVPRTHDDLEIRVSQVIREHQEALDFYNMIQDVYGPWLFFVFLLTSFIISCNLYQLYLNQRFEPTVAMFGSFGVAHIFMPCYYASKLNEVGDAISSEIYLTSWETTKYNDMRKILILMIYRAQKPLILTGWIVVFNMELFKSILQTSYSFFTLITA